MRQVLAPMRHWRKGFGATQPLCIPSVNRPCANAPSCAPRPRGMAFGTEWQDKRVEVGGMLVYSPL
jgi:hypothetical protein